MFVFEAPEIADSAADKSSDVFGVFLGYLEFAVAQSFLRGGNGKTRKLADAF